MKTKGGQLRTVSHGSARAVALEVRPQRLAFAVFEGPRQLLDWGTRTHRPSRSDKSTNAGARIAPLIDTYTPLIAIIRQRTNLSSNTARVVGAVTRRIERELKQHGVRLHFVGADEVRYFFGQYGCKTKHEIASVLADWFEELSWKLPPKRKPWQSERHATALFDAVAVGVAFFAASEAHEDIPG
jgi:hypothetical protein